VSQAFADWADYCVIEDGQVIGRIYEDRHTLPELRWFWSITEHVDPALRITRNGRVPSLAQAKAPLGLGIRCHREADRVEFADSRLNGSDDLAQLAAARALLPRFLPRRTIPPHG
jgi:hypothetical protein